jgi:hypothetical protein
MYLNAVLNAEFEPVFNGTPAEVTAWLINNPEVQDRSDYLVCIGETMRFITIREYMALPASPRRCRSRLTVHG